MEIKNSIAFVTGANRGLGLAFARELLARGAAKVYAGMRNTDGVDIPGVVPVRVDVNDAASVAAAAAQCADTTLVVNNAGIARILEGSLDAGWIDAARDIFETNVYGVVRVSQAFAPILARNGGGAVINVLSSGVWLSRPFISPYAASKAAAWSYTNALRLDLRAHGTLVQGLHVSFIDTDMTAGFDMKKANPREVAARALDGLERGQEEVLADEVTVAVKASLSGAEPVYLNPPQPGK
jgi:NAD(P)-dependent dehydrogenase (short-subunit alcohol dehydrogenase family)